MSSSRSSAQRMRSFTRRATAHLVRPFLTFMAVLLLVLGATPLALLGPASVAYAQTNGVDVRVYLDNDRTGTFTTGEPGVAGAGVRIYNVDNQNVHYTEATLANGEVSVNLSPGRYRVQVIPPEDPAYVVSVPGTNNALVRFVEVPATGAVAVDVGLRLLSSTTPATTRSIVVRVWDDLNGNGIQDADEPGRPGLTLRLVENSGALLGAVPAATYLGDGRYHFPAAPLTTNLHVRVDEGIPTGYTLSPAGVEQIPNPNFPPTTINFFEPQNLDSDGRIVDGQVRASVPDGGADDNTDEVGIGFTRGAVRGYVWRDSNANGLLNHPAEARLNNVTVELVPVGAGSTLTTQTRSIVGTGGRGGFYEFRDVPFGEYTVRIPSTMFALATTGILSGTATSPIVAGGSQGNPASSVMNPSSVVTASVNLTNTNVDAGSHVDDDAWFGFYRGSVGGFIWLDLDRSDTVNVVNGVNEAERGLDNVRVCVDLASTGSCDPGDPTMVTLAGANQGRYLFDNLPLGQAYTITLHADNFLPGGRLEGHGVLTQTVISGTSTFYRVSSEVNATDPFTNTVNFPIIRTRVGNQVFIDDDGDGIFSPAFGETGIQSVTVSLYRANTGALVYTTTTDASGVYTLPETLLSVWYTATFDLSTAADQLPDWGSFFPSPIDLTRPGLPAGNPVDPAETLDTNDYSDVFGEALTGTTRIWYTPPFLPNVQQEANNGVDAGFFALTEVGGKVFFDTDDNARDDGRNEPGMRGVTVTLQSGLTTFNDEVTTLLDGSGFYTFTQVPPGPYTVTVINPDPTLFEFVAQDTIDPTFPLTNSLEVSDVLTTTGETTFTLRSGTVNHGVNAGFRALGSITGLIFEDVDGSGTRNQATGAEDTLHDGTATVTVTVNLPDLLVAEYITTTTALDTGPWGTPNYTLTNLVYGPGVTYTIQFTPSNPAAYFPTVPGATETDIDSDGPIDRSPLQVAEPDSPTVVLDQGYVRPITLTARVFEDLGSPPINEWNLGDPGIDSHPVLVTYTGSLNWAGSALSTTATTDTVGAGTGATDGIATFDTSLLLPPGTYEVATGIPAGFLRVPANSGITTTGLITSGGFLATETAGAGTTNVFGHVRPAQITGTVFFDRNQDDLLAGEPGMSGVTVTLRAEAGAPFANPPETVTIDATGRYTFTGVQPYTYTLEFTNPDAANFAFREGAAGDNSVTTTTGLIGFTDPFTVASGGGAERNAAMQGTRAITGFVFIDDEGNGQSVGQAPLANATVVLTHNVELPNLTTQIITNTLSDATTGVYTLPFLPAGSFTLDFAPPAGAWQPTVSGVAPLATASRGPTFDGTLAAAIQRYDQGYYEPITVTARIFEDALLPSNNIWEDVGLEPGINGATARLTYTGTLDWSEVFASPASQNTIDTTGLVTFTNLPPGVYTLGVITPTGYLAVPANPIVETLTLTSGSLLGRTEVAPDGTTNVFGYAQAARITGTVFFDRDQDDALTGEPGMSGVTVELRNEDGNLLATPLSTFTDPSGVYTFENLLPFTYTVQFINPNNTNFAFRTPAAGDNSVTTTVGVNDGRTAPFPLTSGDDLQFNAAMEGTGSIVGAVWHDEDGNGLFDATESGLDTAVVTVSLTADFPALFPSGAPEVALTYNITTSGFYTFTGLPSGDFTTGSAPPAGAWAPTASVPPANSVAPSTSGTYAAAAATTINHGYYQPITITARVFEDQSMPPDNVWQDTEPGIVDAEVRLEYNGPLDSEEHWPGFFIGGWLTTTSQVGGIATFTNLPPGGYTLVVDTPDGYLPVEANPIISGTFTLASGSTAGQTEEDAPGTINVFGYARAATITGTVWFDSDQNNLQNGDEVGFAGVTVELRDEFGAIFSATPYEEETDESGVYTFSNVLPFTYTVYFISPGVEFTYSATVSGDNDVTALDGTAGRTISFTVNSGNEFQRNAAVVGVGSVTGFVWEDGNGDGSIDGGELPLSDASVAMTLTSVIGLNGAPITVTRQAVPVGPTGIYSFTGLPNGDIQVEFAPPTAGTWIASPTGSDSDGPSVGEYFTPNATVPVSYNQGYYQAVQITARVFEEIDNDGANINNQYNDFGTDDVGIGGVTVTLLTDLGASVAGVDPEVSANTTGLVTFTVAPGSYQLQVDGSAAALNDFLPSPGHNITVPAVDSPLGSGDTSETDDAGNNSFGYYRPSTITGTVFFSPDESGNLSSAIGMDGVTVGLAGPSVPPTEDTDPNGVYTFTGLLPGNYTVTFTNPNLANYAFIAVGDSNAAAGAGPSNTTPFAVGYGLTVTGSSDAALVGLSELEVLSFVDANFNGAWDLPGELPLAGVTANLTVTVALPQFTATFTRSEVTGGTGWYTFTGLPGGIPAQVSFDLSFESPLPPPFWIVTAPGTDSSDPADLTDQGLAVGATETRGRGYYEAATITARVFEEIDNNGANINNQFNNATDAGIVGITVNLLDGAGNPTGSSEPSDPTGLVTFTVVPGSYQLEVEDTTLLAAGFLPSPNHNITVTVLPDPLGTGDESLTDNAGANSFGYYMPSTITGTVFFDRDLDNSLDGEPGVEGVGVLLGGAGLSAPQTTTTGANGTYSFSNLLPGSYTVTFTNPDTTNFSFIVGGDSNVTTDGDVPTSATAAFAVPYSTTVGSSSNAGLIGQSAVEAYAFIDRNVDGDWTGGNADRLDGVTVTLNVNVNIPGRLVTTITREANTLGTANNTFAGLPGAPAGVTFGIAFTPPTVTPEWQLTPITTGDSDPLPALSNQLLVTDTIETRGQGYYQDVVITARVFEEIESNPNFIDNQFDGGVALGGNDVGIAGVQVELEDTVNGGSAGIQTSLDTGLVTFTVRPGTYQLLVLADPTGLITSTGHTNPVSVSGVLPLLSGQTSFTDNAGANSFGYYRLAGITGTVFFDPTQTQDHLLADGVGLQQIPVRLLDSSGNLELATTNTTVDGVYVFPDIGPGNYIVEFFNPDTSEFTFSTATVGANDAVVGAGANTRTNLFALTSGEPQSFNAAVFGARALSGDTWVDADGDGVLDGGEEQLNGVRIELELSAAVSPYLATTTITRTATTSGGNYSFEGLASGTITSLTFTPPEATPPWNATYGTDSNAADAPNAAFPGTMTRYGQGYYQNATITLRIFDEEVLVNNTFDVGEVGLAGIEVTLDPGTLDEATAFSDASGYVTFTVAPAANYILQVPTPATYSRSPGNTEIRNTGAIVSGQNFELLNFGFYRPSSIAGRAWFDSDRDGRYLLGEPLMQGLEVRLIGIDGDSAEWLVQTWPATDLEGGFSFSGLVPTGPAPLPYAQYRICFPNVPAGFVATERVGPLSAEGNSDINADFCTDNFTVAPSRAILHIDAGFVGNNTISGLVWEDLNADGVRATDEPGLEGVVVTVMVTSTSTLTPTVAMMSATSDATGAYTITGVPAASSYHVVSAEPPLGYMLSTPLPAPGAAIPPSPTLSDIGFFQVSSVGGFAWLDLNEDGASVGEPGVVGVEVELLRNGTVVITTTTAATANAINYRFNDIDPGTYTLRFTAPTGYVFIDSGTNSFTSAAVTILSAEDPPQRVDVALRGTASVAGSTWVDANRDGVRDAGEAALADVEVQLSIAVVGASEPFVTNTTTLEDGSYSFVNLPAGQATVSFETPTGYVPTGDAPEAFALAAGAEVADVDQGFAVELTASIAGLTCVDANDNGTCDAGEAPLANVPVQLSIALADGTTFTPPNTATGNDGRYSFVNLPPGTATVTFGTPAGYEATGTAPAPFALAVGQAVENVNRSFAALVPQTASIAGQTCVDTNRNGICDAGEAALAGVQVQLSIAVDGGDTFTSNTTTGENGSYRFANLPAGEATLTFVTPDGYEATGTEGLVRSITLAVGQAVTGVNQGFAELLAEPASIAGRTCVDTNRNGTCDAGEAPLAGVVVRLSIGTLTPETTTAEDGSYSFTNLPAGEATLTFVTPAGYEATGTAGLVRSITLAAGQDVTGVNQGFVQITEEDPTFYVYLPLVAKAPEPQPEPERLPDLVVTAINVIPGEPQAYTAARVEVTIRNDGTAPASGFWVDLYVNPSAAPNVNQRWNDLAVADHFYGLAWDVTTPLQPGEERVLVSEPRSDTAPNGFAPSVSVWPGYFANGANKLYAFVDSWNRDVDTGEIDPNGAVRESNEDNNRFEREINVTPGTAPADAPTVDPSSIPMR